jgi:hypothetical protein
MAAETGISGTGNAHGAYGIRIAGLDAAREFLVPAERDWPRLELVTTIGSSEADAETVGDDRALLKLRNGGEIRVDRVAGRAEFVVPEPLGPAELVHPYLAPAAAVVARWSGRESFHGGAFVVDGGVWALLGEREAGKSTTLAWLAANELPIVCDDMLIYADGLAFAGPRALDLRKGPAARLGIGEYIGLVGARERWRFVLPQVSEQLPLRGFVYLTWADELAISEIAPGERLARIFTHAGLRLPPLRPEVVLDLVTLPAFELGRPHGWDSLSGAGELLLRTLSGG